MQDLLVKRSSFLRSASSHLKVFAAFAVTVGTLAVLIGEREASARASECRPAAATGPRVKRPPDGGDYGYSLRERRLVGQRVVVHFVTRGPDAPKPADADGDGYPNYIEQIRDAGDSAFAFFGAPSFNGRALPGFDVSFCDTAGPTPQLDIYVKDIGPYGKAITPVRGDGGAFMLIRPRLDTKLSGGVRFTVAHELFHIIQFNYVQGGMPSWIAEGTANAMAFLFERVDRLALVQNVDRWFQAPSRSLYDKRDNCDRCYGGIFWWASMGVENGILPPLFERLAATSRSPREAGLGIRQLEDVFSQLYLRRDLALFAQAALYLELRTFSEGLLQIKYSPKSRPPPNTYNLTASMEAKGALERLNGLAAHYIPIKVPTDAKGLEVIVTSAQEGIPPYFQLALGFRPTGRRDSFSRLLWPEVWLGEGNKPVWDFVISTNFKSAAERQGIRLIVSSSRSTSAMYRIVYRACGDALCPERGLLGAPS